MITSTLSLWIAQSESWQTFIDFNLPQDSIARYPFLGRQDDFYISLFGQVYDVLEDPIEKKEDILSIAKGLEIYSLNKKKNHFHGINPENNVLVAAGLYYLADYSASALILGRLYPISAYETQIEAFLLSFFQRRLDRNNRYSSALISFLNSGDLRFLDELIEQITTEKNNEFRTDPKAFTLYFLAETVLKKFRKNNIWTDLLEYNNRQHWENYVRRSIDKRLPVWDFFPSQKIALESGVLSEFKSIALQTPTSSGKTAICELIIYNEYVNNRESKILYLAPFRALAAELKSTFGRNLANLGISSKTIYGGNIPTNAERDLIQNVTLLISTPEKFMAIENSIPDFLGDFSLIVCDEGHLLDDGSRGLNYELLLSRLKSTGPTNRKFLYISAIIPNIERINTWLGGSTGSVVRSTYRATEIEYAFLRTEDSGNSYILDVNPFKPIPQKYLLNKFLTENDFTYQGARKQLIYKYTSVKSRAVATALKSTNSGSVALFTPTKGGHSGVAALALEVITQIDKGLNLPNPVTLVIDGQTTVLRLKDYFRVIFGNEYTLTRVVDFGVLYHNGDLPQYVREVIEDAIRTEKIKLIICTNTLAEGVNLPIRTIVISAAKRFSGASERREALDLRDIKNLVGRAGRAGKETKGLVIVVNPNDFGIIENVIKDQNLEDVNGFLFLVISRISEVVKNQRLTLTNDILEQQSESFKEMIDSIDISIIDLLSEEIKVEELQTTITNLINQTFAKFQSSDEQSETLSTLVNLRGQKLEPIIQNNEFRFLKQSGASLRAYLDIVGQLQLENPLWQNVSDPLQEDWLKFIFDTLISQQPTFIARIAKFNSDNGIEIGMVDILSLIKLWVNGAWFKELSDLLSIDIDLCLRIINSVITFTTQNIASSIIRNVELRLADNKIVMSTVALKFPQNLLYGLRTELQLDLIEIGFNDRISIIGLSNILGTQEFTYSNLNELKGHLRQNEENILSALSSAIPTISYEKTVEAFSYLRILNMN